MAPAFFFARPAAGLFVVGYWLFVGGERRFLATGQQAMRRTLDELEAGVGQANDEQVRSQQPDGDKDAPANADNLFNERIHAR